MQGIRARQVERADQDPAGNTDLQDRSFYPWDARGSWAEYLVDAESHYQIATQGALVGVKVALCVFFSPHFFLFFGRRQVWSNENVQTVTWLLGV